MARHDLTRRETLQNPGQLVTQPVLQEQPTSVSPFMFNLRQRQTHVQALRRDLAAETSETMSVQRREADKLSFARDTAVRDFDTAAGLADHALNRKAAIATNPAIFNNIMALFDPDFSRNVQDINLTRADLQMGRARNKLAIASQRHDQAVSLAEAERQTVKSIFQINRQGLVDVLAVEQAGLNLEQGVRKEQLQFAQDRSVSELRAFLKDPSTVPAQLKGKPGLINAVMVDKLAAKAVLTTQEFNISIARQAQNKREFLNQFGSAEEIKKFQGTLGPDVTPFDMTKRFGELTSLEDAIEISHLAIKTKETAILANQKAIIGKNLGSLAIKDFLADAITNKGRTEIGGIPFSARELQTMLGEASKAETDFERQREADSIAISGLGGKLMAHEKTEELLLQLYSPNDPNPTTEAIPTDILAETVNRNARVQNQKGRINDCIKTGGDGCDAMTRVLIEMIDEGQEFYRKQVTDRVENDYPKDSRPAANQYFTTGRVSAENAQPLLMAVGADSALFIKNDFLGSAWEKFALVFEEVAAEQVTTITPLAGGIQSTSGKNRDSIIIKNALEKSKFRENTVLNMNIGAMAIAANQLAEELNIGHVDEQQRPDPTLNSFARLLDPRNGLLARQFNDDEGALDLTRFLQFMAGETLLLQQAGILQPNETVAGVLFDRARNLVPSIVDQTFTGLYGTAVKSRVFGNQPETGVIKAIDAAEKLIPLSVRTAEEQQQAVAKTIRLRSDVDNLNALGIKVSPDDVAIIRGDLPAEPGQLPLSGEQVFGTAPKIDLTPPGIQPGQKFGGKRFGGNRFGGRDNQ